MKYNLQVTVSVATVTLRSLVSNFELISNNVTLLYFEVMLLSLTFSLSPSLSPTVRRGRRERRLQQDPEDSRTSWPQPRLDGRRELYQLLPRDGTRLMKMKKVSWQSILLLCIVCIFYSRNIYMVYIHTYIVGMVTSIHI